MSFAKYLKCFERFKIQDKKKLIVKFKSELSNLHRAVAQLGDVHEEKGLRLKSLLESQIKELKERLQNFGVVVVDPKEEEEQVEYYGGKFGYPNLGYELVLDPSFRVPDYKEEKYDESFLENLREEIAGKKKWAGLLWMLETIQEKLRESLSRRKDGFEDEHSRVDRMVEMIRKEDGKNWITALEENVLNVILPLQGVERSNETRKRWAEEFGSGVAALSKHHDSLENIIANALKFLVGCAEQTHIDLVNFRLRLVAPLLAGEHGVDYFKAKFQKEVVSLGRTRKWIQDGLFGVLERKIIAKEDLSLFFCEPTLWTFICESTLLMIANQKKSVFLPETFLWDYRRIEKLGRKYAEMVEMSKLVYLCLKKDGHDEIVAFFKKEAQEEGRSVAEV